MKSCSEKPRPQLDVAQFLREQKRVRKRKKKIAARREMFHRTYEKFNDHTMLERRTYVENLEIAEEVLRHQRLYDGCVVECGTWRGGISFGMVEALPEIMEFHCFDSFEGLPPAGPLDGELAHELQQEGRMIAVNNTASLEEFRDGLGLLDPELQKKVHIHKGWFEETLPRFKSGRPISVLRVDCDWYDSVMLTLDSLFDRVCKSGLIIIDDYMQWEGCSKAVHDFLSKRKARERIQQMSRDGVSFIIKDFPLS